jgi:hypothetical protein
LPGETIVAKAASEESRELDWVLKQLTPKYMPTALPKSSLLHSLLFSDMVSFGPEDKVRLY